MPNNNNNDNYWTSLTTAQQIERFEFENPPIQLLLIYISVFHPYIPLSQYGNNQPHTPTDYNIESRSDSKTVFVLLLNF